MSHGCAMEDGCAVEDGCAMEDGWSDHPWQMMDSQMIKSSRPVTDDTTDDTRSDHCPQSTSPHALTIREPS